MMQRPDGGLAIENGQAPMREHESRSAILAELHARPFLPVEAPRRVYHFAFATNDAEVRADRRALLALCEASGAESPPEDAKFCHLALGDWELRWEQHTEFTTYTWSTSLDAADPFARPDPLGEGEIAFLRRAVLWWRRIWRSSRAALPPNPLRRCSSKKACVSSAHRTLRRT